MNIAMPVKEDRLSVVTDNNNLLTVFSIENNQEKSRYIVNFSGNNLYKKIEILLVNKIELMICGAVSNEFLRMIESNNIMVMPWICGRIDEVLYAYLNGKIYLKKYLLPGVCRNKMNCFGRRRNRYKGFNF